MSEKKETMLKVLIDLRPYSNIEVKGTDVDDVVNKTFDLYDKVVKRLKINKVEPVKVAETPVVSKSKETPKETETDTPKCSVCSSVMVVRTGTWGKFWSCPNYPECKGKARAFKE